MKLKRKIICMGVVSMFLLMALTSVSTATSKTSTTSVSAVESKTSMLYDDQLDQENAVDSPTSSVDYIVDDSFWLAQSFKPTFNILTRIKIGTGNSYGTYAPVDVELVIRSAPDGNNIVSGSTQTSLDQLSKNHWLEFDFTDVSVIPENTYYILWRTTSSHLSWELTPPDFNSNPYERGTPWACYYGNWEAVSGDFFFKTYGRNGNDGQHTPERPTLTGPGNGNINEAYTYTATTTDPDGDQIYYYFDWGDGTNTGWKGPFASGTETTESHTWTTKGTYEIKVKAKDTNGCESDWAILSVTMPVNQIISQMVKAILKAANQAVSPSINQKSVTSATTPTSTPTTTTTTAALNALISKISLLASRLNSID